MATLHLPDGITQIDDPLPGLRIDTPASTGLIYFNGAHIAQWAPAGEKPVLWMSEHCRYEPGAALRGGVPVIFPWFGPGPEKNMTPPHGFARNLEWTLERAEVNEHGTARIVLYLDGQSAKACGTTNDYTLELHVVMGSKLLIQLVAKAGDSPLLFEAGLHSYFAVSDVRNVHVDGLDGAAFSDEVAHVTGTHSKDLSFDGECDSVFASTETLRLVDPGWERTLVIQKVGSPQTVVWNPWIDKAANMPDFGDDEWPGMLCVEAVVCRDQQVRLEPHTDYVLSQTITVAD